MLATDFIAPPKVIVDFLPALIVVPTFKSELSSSPATFSSAKFPRVIVFFAPEFSMLPAISNTVGVPLAAIPLANLIVVASTKSPVILTSAAEAIDKVFLPPIKSMLPTLIIFFLPIEILVFL